MAVGQQTIPPHPRGATHRGGVTAALVLASFMTAIEVSIVATAMPRIVAELGSFALLSWVFSAYLLTQLISIPIYGKLADLYGRKPIFLVGMVIFLLASVLCGMATSMVQLIVFRFLQGIGGGAIQPMSSTIAGDLYTPMERHKIQGLFGSVYAISSIAGPTLGAFIVGIGHWSWIFYINIPLGILSFAVLWLFFHEDKHHHKPRIDYLGSLLLVGCTGTLLFALLQGGTAWPWLSWQILGLFAACILFASGLWYWEQRTAEPILPLWIFKHHLIWMAGCATFLNGALMIGYTAMVPTHVQGVLGKSALAAGLALAGMTIGWPLASFTCGRVMAKIGYRRTALLGASIMLVGAVLVYLSAHLSAEALSAALFLVGMGMGYQANAYIITIQAAVSYKERGVATANNLFMRTLGGAVGVATFGSVLNSIIAYELRKSGLPFAGNLRVLDLVNQLLDPLHKTMSLSEQDMVAASLAKGMTVVFGMAIFLAACSLFFAIFLPPVVEKRESHPLPFEKK